MKTNTKTKKVVATKSKTTSVKSTVKAKAKPVAKVTAKTATKPVAKKSVKPVAKATVKKASAPAKKAVVAKKTAKTVVKTVKSVVKAPVKAVKTTKTVVESKKPAAKSAKAVVSTPVKASVPAKKPAAPVAKVATTKAAVKPIVISAPANAPAKPVVRANMIASVRPVMATMPSTANKSTVKVAGTSSSTPMSARPVYRPIQVINKPLAPLQPVRPMAPVAKADEKVEFKKGDYVVYPAHGVGEIEAVETQIIGGMEIKLYAIAFEKDRMRLKVPVFKAHASGLRRLSTANRMQDALKTLQGRAQIRRAMWSRRAQEYETKINSGDPVSIAEVLRDLKRSNDESEQSYSERQIYQSALERLAREVAAVEKITEIEAAERLEVMIKGKRARVAASNDEVVKEAATA